MAQRNISAKFIIRHDTASNWETKNPVIADGEMITVTTSAGAIRHKTGDGIKTYTQLPFEDEPLYNALAARTTGLDRTYISASQPSSLTELDTWLKEVV